MARKRMYRPGEIITSVDSLIQEIHAGRYIYIRGKVQHPGWVSSMQFRTVFLYVRGGSVRFALKNEPVLLEGPDGGEEDYPANDGGCN